MKTYFSTLFLSIVLLVGGAKQELIAAASSSSSSVDDLAGLMNGLTMQIREVPEGDLVSLEDLCAQVEPILGAFDLQLRTERASLAEKTFQELLNDRVEHPDAEEFAGEMQIVSISKELVAKLKALIDRDAGWIATGKVAIVLKQVAGLIILSCQHLHSVWQTCATAYPEESAAVAENGCLFRGVFHRLEGYCKEIQSVDVITAEHLINLRGVIPDESIMSAMQMRTPAFLGAVCALMRRMATDEAVNQVIRSSLMAQLLTMEQELNAIITSSRAPSIRRDTEEAFPSTSSARRRSRSRSRSRDRDAADDRDRDRVRRKEHSSRFC